MRSAVGAEQTLSSSELKAVITEDRSAGRKPSTRLGFVAQEYDPFARRLKPRHGGRQGHNALFVRDSNLLQRRLLAAPHIRVFEKWL